MSYIILDWETISQCDLKKSGAWRYAEDITTSVLTLRWAYGDNNRVGIWHPGDPFPFAKEIAAGYIFTAHNAAFEKAIWRMHMMPVFGWPDIPNEQWDCTLARCANLNIPQDLESAVRVLRLPALKDTEASKAVIALSKLDKHGNLPPVTAADIAAADEYCLDDCKAQAGLRVRLGTLSKAEREIWLLDQEINERGICLDMALIDNMQKIVNDATLPMLQEFAVLTGGIKLASPKLKQWCHDHGVLIPNLQKDTLAAWLKEDDDSDDYDDLAGEAEDTGVTDMPVGVRRALHIKQLVGSASVKKLARARSCVSLDGRARGLLQYHGAGPGLWAGRLLQPQNFPRGTVKADELLGLKGAEFAERKVAAIMTGDAAHVGKQIGLPVETVVSSLRHIIVASPGCELVVGDFAGIQARIALAAAGQYDKTLLMASGVDVYIDMACSIFKMPRPSTEAEVDAFKVQHYEERQYGKNSVIGLCFQMGAAKFLRRYCPGMDLAFAQRIVDVYRKEWAPLMPDLWYGLDEAACDTVHYRTPHEAYGVTYYLKDQWLIARRPSGAEQHYSNPQPIRKEMPWSKPEAPDIRRAWAFQAKKQKGWVTVDAFGGLLTENLASGLARDLLVHAMKKCRKNGLPIVLTVHDEIVADAEKRVDNAKVLKQIMEDVPQWARDMQIPVESETWAADRYRK